VSIRGIILLIIFIPCIPASFFRPFFGLLVWTIISFTALHKYTYGVSATLPWAMVIGVPTILGFFIFEKGLNRIKSRESGLIILLWIWFVLTSIVSTHTPLFVHHAPGTWDHLFFVSKILLISLVTVGIVNSFERFRMLIVVFASCLAFFVLKSIPFLIITSGADRIYGPPASMIGDNNDFGLALNMTLPIFYFLSHTEKAPVWRRFFGILFMLTIPAIFFTYSRGALVGLVAVLGLMLLQVKQKFVLIPVLVSAFFLAATFAPQTWKDRMNPTGAQALDKSAQSRINAWTFSWNLAMDYPISGGGFDTFSRTLFQRYAPDINDIHGPHSIYFGILGEHGFVGLFLYLSLLASALYSTHEVIRLAKPLGDLVAMHYAKMFRLSLVGFMVSGLFLGRQYFDYYYTIVSCIIILKKLSYESWSEETMLDGEPIEQDQVESELEPIPINMAAGIRATT
jgi:probable O-glycosylation ligase (exosortase A-associated)